MRGLCGWFSTRPADAPEAALQGMLSAGGAGNGPSSRLVAGPAALGAFGDVAAPVLVEAGSTRVLVAGHPRLRSAGSDSASLQAIARAIAERGTAALPEIGGDFAIAAWDEGRQRGLLAIDRIGVHPLVYGHAGATLVFGTTLDLLGGHPGIRRELSPQGLYDYLHYHVSPGPNTVFKGLMRLPAGHCIEFGAGLDAAPKPYWSLRFAEDAAAGFDALKREFVALLEASVREAAEGASTGAFLSGGTDSSTVSGMLGRTSGGKARTFSIGFDVQGYDEMSYARIAAKHFGCEHHEYYVTPDDVVKAVPRIAAAYDQPFGNASAIPTFYCAGFAREHGITRLLAGDGGDELFGGNERYAKQHLLGHYEKVPGWVKRGLLEPLGSLPGVDAVMPLRKLKSYVQQARPPMPLRYESTNLLEHLGHRTVFTPTFLAGVDPLHPRALMHDAHAPHAQASLINQMLAIDIRFILADGDLPKVSHMCELAGVDVAYPLLDDRLVTFSEKLTAPMKLRGTYLRWFFKQALTDFLPPEVIAKQKHGFGLPVGAWLTGHKPLTDLAGDSIALLRQRGIVEPRFIDELLTKKVHEHPAYYGTMVWILMMLGIWLDSRKL